MGKIKVDEARGIMYRPDDDPRKAVSDMAAAFQVTEKKATEILLDSAARQLVMALLWYPQSEHQRVGQEFLDMANEQLDRCLEAGEQEEGEQE
jgi:hypothetical protein